KELAFEKTPDPYIGPERLLVVRRTDEVALQVLHVLYCQRVFCSLLLRTCEEEQLGAVEAAQILQLQPATERIIREVEHCALIHWLRKSKLHPSERLVGRHSQNGRRSNVG